MQKSKKKVNKFNIMKLVKTHLIPGGVVKTYDDNHDTIAKFSVDLMAESGTEYSALLKLAADLHKIANAIDDKAKELTNENLRAEFTNHIRAKPLGSKNLQARRQEFLQKMKKDKADEGEVDDPYDTDSEWTLREG